MSERTTSFTIRFSSKKSAIDAERLGNDLINTSMLLQEIQRVRNPGIDLKIDVTETKKGSFEVVYALNAISNMFTSNPDIFVVFFSKLIELAYKLKGKKPVKEDDKGDVYILFMPDGTEIIIDKETYEEFKKQLIIRELLSAKFSNLKKIENSKKYEIHTNKIENNIEIDLSQIDGQENVVEFDSDDNIEIEEQTISKARLYIERISFNEKYISNVTYMGIPLSATIKDNEFKRKVNNNELRFGHGDTIIADISYEVHTSTKKQTIKNSKINKVHKVLPSSINIQQGKLDLEN